MGTVIMETAHTGKCATPLASMNSVYAYAGPTGVFRCRAPYERTDPRRTDPRSRGGRGDGPVRVRGASVGKR
jgi:hypothetical protein